MPYTVYILQCNNLHFYCGITTDLDRRYAQHQAGKAARYTRAFPPLNIVAAWELSSPGRSLALQIEAFIKKKKRGDKVRLIQGKTSLQQELLDSNIIELSSELSRKTL